MLCLGSDFPNISLEGLFGGWKIVTWAPRSGYLQTTPPDIQTFAEIRLLERRCVNAIGYDGRALSG
jgi:hypothetical protein